MPPISLFLGLIVSVVASEDDHKWREKHVELEKAYKSMESMLLLTYEADQEEDLLHGFTRLF